MKKTLIMTVMLAMISLIGFSTEANAQYRRNRVRQYRVNQGSVANLLRRIETKADRFKRSLDTRLDRSRLDGTNREDNINEYVKQFEKATDRLRRDYRRNDRARGAAQEVLQRGRTIDNVMRRFRGNSNAKRQWNSLRNDLSQLARLYRISWRWNG